MRPNIGTNKESTGVPDFWRDLPRLPAGLRLVRRESVVVGRPGPAGADVFDVADLEWDGGRVGVLLAYRPELPARALPPLARRLGDVLRERKRREQDREPGPALLPVVATDVASKGLRETALSQGLGIVDRSGTVIVRGAGVFVHQLGTAPVERPSRARPFEGKGCRIVRFLLDEPHLRHTAQEVAARTETSYAHAFTVLARLEELQLVARASPRSGFGVPDPGRLLRGWVDSGARTALAVEPFHASSTRPESLARAAAAWSARGGKGIFTLASALGPDEVHVSALPHGAYLPGDLGPVVEALRLKRVSPYNFLVLRPDPAAQTEAGGIYLHPRELPHGLGVAVPQLVVDLARAGGRGPEQADFLLQRWVRALPYPEAAP